MSIRGTDASGSLFDPSKYPPFPSDLATVKLETFSLSEFENGDQALEDKLFQVCKERGFFYLNLNGSSASTMQRDCDDIARLAEKLFKLKQEEKDKYPIKDSLFGFKKVGATKTNAQGTPDTAEFFNISKDAVVGNTDRWPLPQIVLDQKPLLEGFTRKAHSTGLKIMSILARKLGLPLDEFEGYHRITEESGDHIRLTHGPPRLSADQPEIQTPGHCDFGTITILFNWLGGLQVWSDPSRGNFQLIVDPDSSSNDGGEKPKWLWVEPPPPNHAIVNLGDAAVKFTNRVLCSGRHRVVPAPGEQGKYDRYSVVYFVRPVDKVVLKALEGSGIPRDEAGEEEREMTAKEWIIKQAEGLGQSITN